MHGVLTIKNIVFVFQALEYVQTETENEKRRLHLSEACKHLNMSKQERFRSLLNQNHKLLYCRVNKCASTFMLGLLENVLSCGRACLREQKETVQLLPFDSQFLLLQNAYSFMFVREPYGRFFSYYANRLYLPKDQWPTTGSVIIKKYRQRPTAVSLKYGYDVSYSEFVAYVIDGYYSDDKENEHVRPMHFNCNPCQLTYDFIGKLETFPSDLKYLLKQWEYLIVTDTVPDEVIRAQLAKYLYRPVDNLFQALRAFKGSPIPVYNLLVRTWTYYQIRSKVSKTIPMPFSKAKAGEVTKDQYIEKLAKAIEESKGIPGLKEQKTEAMRQAYSSVPKHLLYKLQDVVRTDCELFGYDIEPDDVFHPDYNGDFDYFKAMRF